MFIMMIAMDDPSHEQLPAYCFSFCDSACIQESLQYEFDASLVCTVLTLLVSAYHIYMHLHNFNNPFFQSKIIVILIMAPFYCLTSMGSFILPDLEIYFTLTRDSYEALLLFVFFYLMFSYIAYDRQKDMMEDRKVYTVMIEHEKEVHHFWPFGYCQKPYQLTHWKKAKYFTYRCKKYVLQFLVVKIFTTLLMYVVYPNQHGHTSEEVQGEAGGSYYIIASIVNWVVAISASYSLYYLVLFYHALSHPLAPYSALLKFLTIKITIFFTFWQRIMIVMFEEQFLACFDEQAENFNERKIISSLQNTLICFEMLLMAIAGGVAYSYESYVSQNATNQGNFGFVIKDTIRAFKNDFRLIKPKKFGFTTEVDQEIQLMDMREVETCKRRESVFVSIKSKRTIADSMVEDYL